MAFWDKLFKKKEENIVTAPLAKEPQQAKVDKALLPSEVNTKYSAYFSLSTQEEQKRIIEFIRPITDKWQVMNLKLSYGVRVEKADLFMVSYRTLNECAKDTGKMLYRRQFVVLHKGECLEASYTSNNLHDEGELVFSVPKELEEPLKQAMDFYRNWQEHKVFEKACKEQEPSIDTMKIDNTLKAPLFKEFEVYEAQQKQQKLAQRKAVEINSEEAAKELFFSCQPYNKMKEEYTEETVKAFEKFATGEKKKEWVIEECKQILKNIIQGDRENVYEKLEKINGKCSYFLGSASDALAEDYTQACKVLFADGEERFVVCIHQYLSYLKNSPNPAVAKELLDMTEKYYKEKYTEEYERGSIGTHPQKFKSICCMLRGKMRETSPAENTEEYQFVEIKEDNLRQIVLWYRKKYNDDAAVKESIAELNCAYGVESDKLFLTARCNAADSYFLQEWDRFWFVAILKETGEVMEFRCRREAEDGGFVADYFGGSSKEHWSLLVSAVEYYRNLPERKLFFEAYMRDHEGVQIADWMKNAHKGLLSKFKRHYEKEYKRVNDNLLKDILVKVVDLCEEKGPVYGYKNTIIGKPVTDDEITAWEQEQGIALPEQYKQFLHFANGIQFFGSSEYISGLKGLRVSDEYLDADYIYMGEMIGDGTMICMSKTNGRIYIADHGAYEDKGEFADFLEYFVDFLKEM